MFDQTIFQLVENSIYLRNVISKDGGAIENVEYGVQKSIFPLTNYILVGTNQY